MKRKKSLECLSFIRYFNDFNVVHFEVRSNNKENKERNGCGGRRVVTSQLP